MTDKIIESLLVQAREANDRILAKLHEINERQEKLNKTMKELLDRYQTSGEQSWEKKTGSHGD